MLNRVRLGTIVAYPCVLRSCFELQFAILMEKVPSQDTPNDIHCFYVVLGHAARQNGSMDDETCPRVSISFGG